MFWVEIVFLAVVCFLGGYAKGRLSGFDRGLKEGLKIGKESKGAARVLRGNLGGLGWIMDDYCPLCNLPNYTHIPHSDGTWECCLSPFEPQNDGEKL